MRKFSVEEVVQLLQAADRHLDAPHEVLIIGGIAVGLWASMERSTSDLDMGSRLGPALVKALDAAKAETGLQVPVQAVGGVYDAPYDFEERLQPAPIPGLRHLIVRLPEPHDLALMKLARGYTHDIDAVELLHSRCALDLGTLVQRFHDTEVVGNRRMFELSLVGAVERLFGPERAADVSLQLQERRRQQQRDRGPQR